MSQECHRLVTKRFAGIEEVALYCGHCRVLGAVYPYRCLGVDIDGRTRGDPGTLDHFFGGDPEDRAGGR